MLKVLSCLAFLAFSAVIAPSQVSTTITMNKPEKPTIGLPFTADQTIQIVQHLGNGMAVTHDMEGHVCRTADGLERYEGTITPTDPAKPSATQVLILDRAKHTTVLLNSNLKTAIIEHLPADATIAVNFLALPPPRVQNQLVRPENPITTDLGKRTENMIPLVGKRVTGTIPAGKIGNDKPLLANTEVWFAPQLKLVVKEVEQNPITGERTFELTNIRSEEPDPKLFEIPEGYTVKDKPPMPTGMPSLGSAVPEQRTKQIEDALASPDPNIKDNVVFALAYNGDHLADAQILGEQMVRIAEQETSDVVAKGDPGESFHQMLVLSRYWGTLGYVYYRQGQQQKAEAFTRAAWELNPNELFCSHLGRIYEAQHRPNDAIAFYRMALNTKVGGAEQDLLLTRLAALGVPRAEPLKIDVETPLPLIQLHLAAGDVEPLVDILLRHDAPPAVTLRQGNPASAQSLTKAIQSALAQSLPDNGPEQLLRRAHIRCTSSDTPTCLLHFIGSSEASDKPASTSN